MYNHNRCRVDSSPVHTFDLRNIKKNTKKSGLLTAVFCTLLAIMYTTANAATYCVAAADGNDTSEGSLAAPWQSIAKAQLVAKDGDSVILRSGDYGTFTDSSAHTNFITYKADKNAIAIFQDIKVKSSAFLRFDGVKVNSSVNAYGAINFELLNSTVAFKGPRYSSPVNLVDIRFSKNALIKGNTITNGKTAIKIDNAISPTISTNHIYNLAVDAVTATPVKNMLFEYNHIHDLNQDRIICKDIRTTLDFNSPSPNVSVRNIKGSSLNIVVQNSFTTGVLAYVNFSSPQSLANITQTSLAIKTAMNYPAGSLAIRVSTAADANTSGIYKDIPLFECTANSQKKSAVTKLARKFGTDTMTEVRSIALVQTSDQGPGIISINEWTFSNGAHQDYLVISGSDIIIRNNIFHDGASQGIFTSPADANNVTIENNLMYDLGGTNLTNLSLRGNCVIRNNTFVGFLRSSYENKPASPSHFTGHVGIIALDDGANFKICNNIVVGELSSVGAYNCYNIVQSQTRPGPHTLVLSGPTGGGYMFAINFFENVNFNYKNEQIMDYKLAKNSPAVNFGNTACQSATSLGSLDTNGFVLATAPTRDESHYSAGAREIAPPSQ